MHKALPPGRYGFFDLVRSEWTKIRTVRSTMWTIGVTIVLGIGIGALVCALTRSHWSSVTPAQHATFDAPATSLIGLLFAQFAIGILGVLVISAEYSTGTIRATFSAAPNRSRVFAAKIVVFVNLGGDLQLAKTFRARNQRLAHPALRAGDDDFNHNLTA